MALIYEFNPDEDDFGPGDVDGMEEFMAELDEPTSTDWDAAVEPPPHNIEPEIKALWNKKPVGKPLKE